MHNWREVAGHRRPASSQQLGSYHTVSSTPPSYTAEHAENAEFALGGHLPIISAPSAVSAVIVFLARPHIDAPLTSHKHAASAEPPSPPMFFVFWVFVGQEQRQPGAGSGLCGLGALCG